MSRFTLLDERICEYFSFFFFFEEKLEKNFTLPIIYYLKHNYNYVEIYTNQIFQ